MMPGFLNDATAEHPKNVTVSQAALGDALAGPSPNPNPPL